MGGGREGQPVCRSADFNVGRKLPPAASMMAAAGEQASVTPSAKFNDDADTLEPTNLHHGCDSWKCSEHERARERARDRVFALWCK